MTGTTLAKRAEVADRRKQAILLALDGRSWDQIAAELGYSSRGAAYKDIQRAMEIMTRDHPLVQGGKVVMATVEVDVDGVMTTRQVPMLDAGPSMAAADRLLKIDARRSDLLGTNAPVRVQQETTVRYEIFGFDMSQLR